ncbi:unnamed protein product [Orchesella dallaii]|uniref:Uncharacterized protein n=1 Tax=Orchesella dallaii TaxID=48710 RepID=A0ABP1Q4K0_9HEXA
MSKIALSNKILNDKTNAIDFFEPNTETPFLKNAQQQHSIVVLQSQVVGKGSTETPIEGIYSNTTKTFPAIQTETSTKLAKLTEICGIKISLVYIYSVAATIGAITVLLLLIKNQIHAKDENIPITQRASAFPQFPGLSIGGNNLITLNDWKEVEQKANTENIVHFNVGKKTANPRSSQSQPQPVTTTIDDGALLISGRPNFCRGSVLNTPEELVFENVLHLHLSSMENCTYYTNLILTKWSFPNVRSIKLQKMVIKKEEFVDLTKFIARNNETLRKVEIDESYTCPSPTCDPGMIDFPNHDFQLTITRRRESPKWIYA